MKTTPASERREKDVSGGRWEDVVRKSVEGGEVDVLVDCLGGESLERGTRLAKGGGRVVTIGSRRRGGRGRGEWVGGG